MVTRTVTVLVTGSSAQLKAALAEAGIAADATSAEIGDKMEAASTRTGGVFAKLGNQLSNWGLPFGESVSKIGDKLADAETKGQKFGQAMSTLGGVTLAAGALGFAAIGAESVHMASDFQDAMTQLVTGAGESQKNIKMVGDAILAMAGEVGQTPQQLAAGMFLIESAGYHGAAGLTVLKSAAEGAAAGGADMSTVANALTTAMHDYNIPTDRANAVTSALIETVASGKTHLEDLASSLGKVMPQAAALGINFQTVTGAMATMTNAGLSARLAAQHLSNTLLSISAPGSTASAAMTSVGLSAQQVKDALDGPDGLSGALDLIETHVGDTFPKGSVAAVQAFKDIMGGATGYSTALMLTGANSATFEKNVTDIGNRLDGSAKSVQGFSKVQGDLSFQLAQAKATAEALGVKLGEVLIPKLEDLGKALSDSITWFEKHKLVAEALALVIGGVLATAVTVFAVTKMVSLVGALGDGIAALGNMGAAALGMATTTTEAGVEVDAAIGSTGLGLVIIGLGLAIALLATHWKLVWGAIKDAAKDAWDWIYGNVGAPLANFFEVSVPHALDTVKSTWDTVWGDIQSVVQSVWNVLKPIFDKITGAISDIVGGIGKVVGTISSVAHAGGAVNPLNWDTGGPVPGAVGSPVFGTVHGGEWVLSHAMVTGSDTSWISQVPGAAAAVASRVIPASASSGGGGTVIAPTYNISVSTTGAAADLQQTIEKAIAQSHVDLVTALRAN